MSTGLIRNLELSGTDFLHLNDTATVWDDVLVTANAVRVNGTQGTEPPTYAKFIYNSTRGTDYSGLFAYSFPYSANSWQDANITVQLPHRYKEGSTIYPHVHCSLQSAATGTMLLEAEYIWSNVNEAKATTTTISTWNLAVTTASLVSDNFIISLPSISGIVKANATISSILDIRFSRIVKNAAWTYPVLTGGLVNDNWNGTLWLRSFDVHFEIDSLGSKEELIK